MKRKQVSDLRTNPIGLVVGRTPCKLELWGVSKLQPFFPPIECLFKTDSLERVEDYGIKLNESIVSVTEDIALLSSGRVLHVHPKITMLLSPFKCMKGAFGTFGLPMRSDHARDTQSKLQSYNTAGYVGAILSIALSQSGCQHFPEVVGVFTGNAKTHTIDISDDYEELSDRPWFSQNIGKTFALRIDDHVGTPIEYTRCARKALALGEDTDLGEVENLTYCESDVVVPGGLTSIFKEDETNRDSESDSGVSTAYIFDIESVSAASEDSICSEEDDESFAWATFTDVSVQMTVMERLDGTLYELLKANPESDKQFAWLAQIIFALAYAQRNFAFTHNDLHGNNVMFTRTEKEFFYYFHAGQTYKVPTYGYVLKIIDFDRGIGSIKLPGMKDAKVFMSDQHAASEEAGGQYNCEPFLSDKFRVIKPNPSFDLARLATSLFWDLFPLGPNHDTYCTNPVFMLFMKWMTLEDGTSILFYSKNPKIDRYVGFSLYKAIARFCKQSVPRKEISELKCFLTTVPCGESSLVIDV